MYVLHKIIRSHTGLVLHRSNVNQYVIENGPDKTNTKINTKPHLTYLTYPSFIPLVLNIAWKKTV